ncbi:MAG: response regulator [Clostridiales bacterium]|nr:response regulator [Clostridiales bacterium]
MPRKRTTLIAITVIILLFVTICTWYSYHNIKEAVRIESYQTMNSIAEALVERAKNTEDSDLGAINLYYGNGEAFIIDRSSHEVLYNSSDVKIGPELKNLFDKNTVPDGMSAIRMTIDSERELILAAPERTVYNAVYRARQAFVLLIAVELFAFAAYIYLVFASAKRSVEKTLLEEHLKKVQKADEAKSLFISSMSHDLRIPMSSSIGFTDLAYDNAENPEKTREYLKKVRSSNEHLLTLVNDIIDVNRIENGNISIKEEAYNLYSVAAGIDEMVRPEIEAKKITFATDFSGIIDENVYCDKLHIKQIFFNIFSNAVKFTDPGGNIKFEIIQLKCDQPGYGLYEFRVRDSGIGIGADFMPYVFEPFTRENSVGVNKTTGAGLGLTITKQIIDMMDGSIAVKSEPFSGAEFIVRLRFKLASTGATLGSRNNDYEVFTDKFQGRKLLLVEDNGLNREMEKDLLEECGFIVNDVDDGTVAVAVMEQAKAGEYAAIIMDIQMPNMDGYEATRLIRKMPDPAIARIPIVAMTANAFNEDRLKSREAGMNAHITKPIDMDKLLKVLDKLI